MSGAEYTLGKQCGVTFAGIKPASLFGMKRSEAGKLKGLERRFRKRGFSFERMKRNGERVSLYIYHAERLKGVLFDSENKNFLEGLGYRYGTVSEAVGQLKKRMRGEDFPHEVGIFLGYPLEDVRGFIADPCGGTMLGWWKVYRNAEEKAKTFARFRQCTECICRKLESGQTLAQIFRVVR